MGHTPGPRASSRAHDVSLAFARQHATHNYSQNVRQMTPGIFNSALRLRSSQIANILKHKSRYRPSCKMSRKRSAWEESVARLLALALTHLDPCTINI